MGPAQLRQLTREALAVVSGADETHRVPALEVLRQLQPDNGAGPLLGRGQASDVPLPSRRQAQSILDRICATTTSRMCRDALRDDPVLRQVLEEMMFHPQLSLRGVACALLRATPYRHEIANAIAGELRNRSLLSQPDLASTMVDAASKLGDESIRPLLEELTLSTGLPGGVNESALSGLAHCAGSSSDAFWQVAMRRHGHIEKRARRVIYALGVARRQALLKRYLQTTTGATRTAAAWWLNIPRQIAASTSRQNEHPGE